MTTPVRYAEWHAPHPIERTKLARQIGMAFLLPLGILLVSGGLAWVTWPDAALGPLLGFGACPGLIVSLLRAVYVLDQARLRAADTDKVEEGLGTRVEVRFIQGRTVYGRDTGYVDVSGNLLTFLGQTTYFAVPYSETSPLRDGFSFHSPSGRCSVRFLRLENGEVPFARWHKGVPRPEAVAIMPPIVHARQRTRPLTLYAAITLFLSVVALGLMIFGHLQDSDRWWKPIGILPAFWLAALVREDSRNRHRERMEKAARTLDSTLSTETNEPVRRRTWT